MNTRYFKFTKCAVLALALLAVSCMKDDTDGMDTATRVSLSPAPVTFTAEGLTESGAESYVGAVVVAQGSKLVDLGWEASVEGDKSWVEVNPTTVTSDFSDTWDGSITTVSEAGIEIRVKPNTEYRRWFNLLIHVGDGSVIPFEFMQLGEKADAAVSSETKNVEFVAAGGEQTILYTTNMGEVYDFEATYDDISSDWLTWEADHSGEVKLKAKEWTDRENIRTAVFSIIVGTDETSKARLDIPVTQLSMDDYYYMYGPSCDEIPIENAIQLTKREKGIYFGDAYFMNSTDGTNTVMINHNSRTLTYPCYALGADGSIVEIANEQASAPAGPEIDIDGRRLITLNFNDMTWTWSRITTANCMPDSEVANYKTKSYIARDGSMKTWMVEFVRWDGGDIYPKLGSAMIPSATGTGAGGTGGYAAANFPTSWNDPNMNMNYESSEIGGALSGTSEYGRIYGFEEMVVGTPRFGIGYSRHETLPAGWTEGCEVVDAVGDRYTVEYIVHTDTSTFTGNNDVDEANHPTLTWQIQGICPYGWHIANAADWIDIAYAASQASPGHTYAIQEDQVTYKQLTSVKGGYGYNDAPVSERGIGNFAAWLRNSYWTGGVISDGAEEFGFNYYPLGWRYMTQGYQCYGTRCQTWVPLIYSSTAAFRINVMINNTVTSIEMANLDNGQAIVAFRCVKNYRK